MIHEAIIEYITVGKNGNDKKVKEKYIIDGLGCFSEVEAKLVDEFIGLTAMDVVDIKRSKIKEVANSRQSDDDEVFIAELMDIFHDDDGTEKSLKYKIAFFEKSMEKAMHFISEYKKQGYDMKLVSLNQSTFTDVL